MRALFVGSLFALVRARTSSLHALTGWREKKKEVEEEGGKKRCSISVSLSVA